MIFGAGSLEDKALALCKMFYTAFVNEQQQQQIDAEIAGENQETTIEEIEVEEDDDAGDEDGGTPAMPETPSEKKAKRKKLRAFLHSMRVIVLLLARSYDPLQVAPEPPRFSADLSSLSEHVPSSSRVAPDGGASATSAAPTSEATTPARSPAWGWWT